MIPFFKMLTDFQYDAVQQSHERLLAPSGKGNWGGYPNQPPTTHCRVLSLRIAEQRERQRIR